MVESREINLLSSLPKSERDVGKRSIMKDAEVIRIAKQFGYEYWDGDRKYGYGGHYYDGRWRSVARDIVKFFDLKRGAKILDIGCGKGFLLYDLLMGGDEYYLRGIDVSQYAIQNSPAKIRNRLKIGCAEALPFKSKAFDLVISINTLHNLSRRNVIRALREIERVSRGNSYIVVDSYRTPEERELFGQWVLTAETHMYPEQWVELFKEAGYGGYYGFNYL